jgi:hypothetical protein
MRRIDAIAISLGIFGIGGIAYVLFQSVGFNSLQAGIWAQTLLVAGIIGWLLTYLFRVITKNMTYNQQLKNYEDAVLQKRLEEMSPDELEKLMSEVEQEKSNRE